MKKKMTTTRPRPLLRKATADILATVDPLLEEGDWGAVLSGLATSFAIILACRVFAQRDELAEQHADIDEAAREFAESIAATAREHLTKIRSEGAL